jgi:hypothetical protein
MPRLAVFVWLALGVALNGCSDSEPQSPNAGLAGGGNSTSSSGGGGSASADTAGGGNSPNAAGADTAAGKTNAGGSPTAGTAGASTGGAGTGGASAGGAGGAGAGGAGAGGNAAGGATGGGGGQASASSGCIVPLYSYPSDAAWTAIVKAKQAHSAVDVVAIVNPSSGPGAGVDGAFTSGIAKLVAAGIVPIGYVSTSYTNRGETAVNADTDKWRTSYPAVQGIFFDEQSISAGDETFYVAVSAHAKTKGFTLTVGNPGTGVPDSFLGSVDVMLSYESAGTPKLTNLTRYAAHRDQFGIIPYATAFDAAFVKAAAKSVRYVYLTDDDLPNPWDTLPSYFDALLGVLAP